jgi:hypothetical protein
VPAAPRSEKTDKSLFASFSSEKEDFYFYIFQIHAPGRASVHPPPGVAECAHSRNPGEKRQWRRMERGDCAAGGGSMIRMTPG